MVVVQQRGRTALLVHIPHYCSVRVLLIELAHLVSVLPVQAVSLQVQRRRLYPESPQLQQAAAGVLLVLPQLLLTAV